MIFFKIALIFGAPLAALAPGAAEAGALPYRDRLVAGLTAVLMLFAALAIVSAAGFPGLGWPRWTGWATVTLHGASAAVSRMSRKPAERAGWAPLQAVLAALALVVVTA
ncbi:hypothetical protein [Salipiger sp.]|uniref:hypothetical protein n=1 Tax=Salipiger sp. TaxID=2078585 RepID=UPI003A9820A0